MSDARVFALPVQLIEVPGGVLVKRGTTELLISGSGSMELIMSILLQAGDPLGISVVELLGRHPVDSGTSVAALLEELRARRILVDAVPRELRGETPFDVLAWDAHSDPDAVRASLAGASVHVLGVNAISRRLIDSFANAGGTISCVDHPQFRNVRQFGEGPITADSWGPVLPEPYDAWSDSLATRNVTCLVVCSDFGGLQLLSDWNEVAWSNGWNFLSVVLQDLVGFVGPLVVPGETACFECFLARRDASAVPTSHARTAEAYAYGGQAVTGYHPSMASILGDIAAMELTKFYGNLWRSDVVNRVIEVNLMGAAMASRRLLKVPRCPVCSPLNETEPVGILKEVLSRVERST